MTTSIGGTTGITFPDASVQNTAATGFGFKNRLINGNMSLWQRATSSAGFTATGGPSGYLTADRWTFYALSATTASQSSSVPSGSGFPYSLKVQRPAAAVTTNTINVYQVIESANMLDLAGQSVTLSFWAKAGANYSSSGSVLNCFVNTGTVADQGSATGLGGWTGGAQPLYSAVTLTTTWQRFTVTATIGATALEMDVGFYYTPTGTAGADDAFYVTGVQLEKGSTATAFDYRPYGTELSLCQRYYTKSSALEYYLYGAPGATYGCTFRVNWPVTMRANPTYTPVTSMTGYANYSNVAVTTNYAWDQIVATTSTNIYYYFTWTATAEL